MPAVSFAALWVPGRRGAGGRGEGVHLPRVLATVVWWGAARHCRGPLGLCEVCPRTNGACPVTPGPPGRLTRLLRDAECRRGNAVCFFRPWAQLNSGGMTLPLVLPPAENHSSW